jgi:hypothetical protein
MTKYFTLKLNNNFTAQYYPAKPDMIHCEIFGATFIPGIQSLENKNLHQA